MQNSKVATYIGFAVKARKVVWGIDALKARRRNYSLIVVSGVASERLKADVQRLYEGKSPIVTVDNLSNYTHTENCGVIAITDKELAKAILKSIIDER